MPAGCAGLVTRSLPTFRRSNVRTDQEDLATWHVTNREHLRSLQRAAWSDAPRRDLGDFRVLLRHGPESGNCTGPSLVMPWSGHL